MFCRPDPKIFFVIYFFFIRFRQYDDILCIVFKFNRIEFYASRNILSRVKKLDTSFNNHLCQQGERKAKYGINHAVELYIHLGFKPSLNPFPRIKGGSPEPPFLLRCDPYCKRNTNGVRYKTWIKGS